MTDLKITLSAYAVIQRKKFWDGNYAWETINTIIDPKTNCFEFFTDAQTIKLEEKLKEGLKQLDFSPVITRVKDSYDSKKEPLEELKDLLMTLYAELQDVKANTEDDKLLLDLLQHMDSELVTAAKIVAALKKEEVQDK